MSTGPENGPLPAGIDSSADVVSGRDVDPVGTETRLAIWAEC